MHWNDAFSFMSCSRVSHDPFIFVLPRWCSHGKERVAASCLRHTLCGHSTFVLPSHLDLREPEQQENGSSWKPCSNKTFPGHIVIICLCAITPSSLQQYVVNNSTDYWREMSYNRYKHQNSQALFAGSTVIKALNCSIVIRALSCSWTKARQMRMRHFAA